MDEDLAAELKSLMEAEGLDPDTVDEMSLAMDRASARCAYGWFHEGPFGRDLIRCTRDAGHAGKHENEEPWPV